MENELEEEVRVDVDMALLPQGTDALIRVSFNFTFVNPDAQPFCDICLDRVERCMMRTFSTCEHRFCAKCLREYIAGAVRTHVYPIRCPTCRADVSRKNLNRLVRPRPAMCQRNKDALVHTKALLRRLHGDDLVHKGKAMYCPCNGCEGTITFGRAPGNQLLRRRCADCGINSCIACRCIWHRGKSCAEHQKAVLRGFAPSDEERALMHVARRHGYGQCPQCGMLVEKTEGCDHILCFCGTDFNINRKHVRAELYILTLPHASQPSEAGDVADASSHREGPVGITFRFPEKKGIADSFDDDDTLSVGVVLEVHDWEEDVDVDPSTWAECDNDDVINVMQKHAFARTFDADYIKDLIVPCPPAGEVIQAVTEAPPVEAATVECAGVNVRERARALEQQALRPQPGGTQNAGDASARGYHERLAEVFFRVPAPAPVSAVSVRDMVRAFERRAAGLPLEVVAESSRQEASDDSVSFSLFD